MPTKAFADAEIIQGLQKGGSDHKYEDALYMSYSYFIEEGIRKFSLTEDESFSCYSDSIIKTLDNIRIGVFEGRSSLKTYLYQIFHNKCVDQVRKNTTKKSEVYRGADISDMLFRMSDTAKTIIQRLVEQSDIQELKKRLSELGENCRKMLLMSSDGYSDKEIAVVLEFKSASVAKTSRLRCLERLRKLYKVNT